MTMQRILSAAALALVVSGLPARAETAAYGLRLNVARWEESELFGDRSPDASGVSVGPSLLFRFGEGDELSAGFEGFYGSMSDLDRADLDVTFGYNISALFGVFLDLRYFWYDIEKDGAEASNSGLGLGPGVQLNVPFGGSGLFFFANTRVIPMALSLDDSEADDAAVLWAYEGGLAIAIEPNTGVNDSNVYLALGYRHQQMKGSDVDETMQMPFFEAGFKQEF